MANETSNDTALHKTGECYDRDEAGLLWLCESFVDAGGEVTTRRSLVDEAGQQVAAGPSVTGPQGAAR